MGWSKRMWRARRPLLAMAAGVMFMALTACDPEKVVDTHHDFDEPQWAFADSVTVPVTLNATDSTTYNIYVNVRNIDFYPYSNLYLQIAHMPPQGTRQNQRLNLRLADDEGRWLGNGAGSLWDNQIRIATNVPLAAGEHSFTLKHDMRDNPLPGIADIGLRIEKSTPENSRPKP